MGYKGDAYNAWMASNKLHVQGDIRLVLCLTGIQHSSAGVAGFVPGNEEAKRMPICCSGP